MKTNDAFAQGVAHFNAGRFFEAHEAWEQLWLASPEPTKAFLQGMIQIAAAFHHYERGNLGGAHSLIMAGFRKIQAVDKYRNIALNEFKDEISEWIALLAEGKCPTDRVPPEIRAEEANR